MKNQYSDSSGSPASPLTLAFDTGSPLTSVALGRGDHVLGTREAEGGRSSARLLRLIDELLAAHDLERGAIERVIAARGPGSFTGLRVGLATALGLHQALGIEATAIGSLRLLARAAADAGDSRPVVALVDALRGEWFARPFGDGGRGVALAEAAIVSPSELLRWAPCRLTGFGLERLPPAVTGVGDVDIDIDIELIPARALAPTLLELAGDTDLVWDPAPLVEPLYLRAPAAVAG